MNLESEDQATNEEIALFIKAIHQSYGYDFRDYAPASLRRRVLRARELFECASITELQARAVRDKTFFALLLSEMTVTVSEMFRDPKVYRKLIDEVFPVLATYPSIRIWHAGCSTGEEVYSMAILLHEEGLLKRTTLYATDINPTALRKARSGVFTTEEIQISTANYQKAGRLGSFSDYYTADYGSVLMDRSLRDKVVFAEHNLATDSVFSEVHLILCRNVMIYFNRAMQNRVLKTFYDSLLFKGFMCLGPKETLSFSDYQNVFSEINLDARIFQKLGGH
ncbi:MAG TPA: protein-glutamate O-methyltransferase CheR [Oligoflexus sp.]|uniref:CheR family methyltransferase n=1 Tax=Oligoflexus sp. TaxID=1971216 RepID=UPI002D6F3143|nr:protein-glutamate O-methyltransferase CheR [Oligoflexus sp.]HYX36377.1 protein-glutamate O-methyltransferase CheR [Oligoflexus sp.]